MKAIVRGYWNLFLRLPQVLFLPRFLEPQCRRSSTYFSAERGPPGDEHICGVGRPYRKEERPGM